jgi:cold shock CspA family protein
MPSGTIKTIDFARGFAFIVPNDGSNDVYLRLSTCESASLLRRGLQVEYHVAESQPGKLEARNVVPSNEADVATESAHGRVKFWDNDKGFGFVVAEDGRDLYLARRSTRFEGNQAPAEGDEVDVEYVHTGEKNPVVIALKIISLAPWKPSGIPFFDFAELGGRAQAVDQLAAIAEPEPWDNSHEPTGGKPILDSYLRYTYVRLVEEGKVSTSTDGAYAAFNTGLVTPMQEEIFALFVRNPSPDKQPWQLLGFRKRSDRLILTHFGHALPDLANYFDDPSVLLYDRRVQLHINIDHVIEHLERFPEPLNSNEFLARQAIQAAEVNTRSRVYRNYKAAIPQWYRDPHSDQASVQLLLPLCLRQPDKADLALVVDRVGDAYRGNTVLTLDMAYRNARLLARPDSDWLVP